MRSVVVCHAVLTARTVAGNVPYGRTPLRYEGTNVTLVEKVLVPSDRQWPAVQTAWVAAGEATDAPEQT